MLERNITITYQREKFDPKAPDFDRWLELYNAHALELRGMKADIDIDKYLHIQDQGRLVVIAARNVDGLLIGYSVHIWHRDLHFNQKVAQDDAQYVIPELRNQGIGKKLREISLEELKKYGIRYVYARFKTAYPHDLTDLNYVPFEQIWIHKIR